MANFPSNWLDFSDHKEIKRLRKQLTDSLSLRIQIAASVIVAIISFFLSSVANTWATWMQVIVVMALCIATASIFLAPVLVKRYRFYITNNIMIDGETATNVFDDEVVYDVMIATEFHYGINDIIDDETKGEIRQFYVDEIHYYISDAIEKIITMSANSAVIFGAQKHQILHSRAINICNLINILISKYGTGSIDTSVYMDYSAFVKNINNEYMKTHKT